MLLEEKRTRQGACYHEPVLYTNAIANHLSMQFTGLVNHLHVRYLRAYPRAYPYVSSRMSSLDLRTYIFEWPILRCLYSKAILAQDKYQLSRSTRDLQLNA